MKKRQRWRNGSSARAALNRLSGSRRHFAGAGREIISACAGSIFPADIYFVATCNRALQTFDAFLLTMKADFYSTSMILLRVQLDSVLRCYGLLQTSDPHDVAQQILNGARLSDLKDKEGARLTDGNLVDAFSNISESNKVIKQIYGVTSGYVHLSGTALHKVLSKTEPMASGDFGFYIDATEPDAPMTDKLELIQSFEKVTDAIFALAKHWAEIRDSLGSVEYLVSKYGPKVQ